MKGQAMKNLTIAFTLCMIPLVILGILEGSEKITEHDSAMILASMIFISVVKIMLEVRDIRNTQQIILRNLPPIEHEEEDF